MTSEWVPLALARDVPAGTTRAAIVEDRELVIWRGVDGQAHVWADRCPHRGMRLSLGFVRDNALNCLYHGWAYAADGGCRRIPAHPDLNVPGSIRADVHRVVEAGGMIWTRQGGEEPTLPELPDGTPVCCLAVESDPRIILSVAGAEAGRSGLQWLSLQHAGASIHVGWHQVRAGKTMLHAVVEGGRAEAALRLLRDLRAEAEGRVAA